MKNIKNYSQKSNRPRFKEISSSPIQNEEPKLLDGTLKSK